MIQIKKAEFVTSVANGGIYIRDDKPQIAMVGRSNVGKSSFINTICNNYKLARISSSPGKTRLINYFSINNGQFYFVDLPGYGFAKAPKTEHDKWGELIEGYLNSGAVTHIFLLLDSRHTPTQDDRQMFSWIQYFCVPYTIIATKVDKLPRSGREQFAKDLGKAVGSISPAIGFSSQDRTGLQSVLNCVEQIVCDVALQTGEK